MIIVTSSETNAIVSICSEAIEVSNGTLVKEVGGSECIIPNNGSFLLHDVGVVPEYVKPGYYKYTPSDGFVKDGGYKPYIPIEKKIEIIEDSTAEYMVDLDFRLSNIELGL